MAGHCVVQRCIRQHPGDLRLAGSTRAHHEHDFGIQQTQVLWNRMKAGCNPLRRLAFGPPSAPDILERLKQLASLVVPRDAHVSVSVVNRPTMRSSIIEKGPVQRASATSAMSPKLASFAS